MQRAQGAAVQERDGLVSTALHALNQLRLHLGSIHALRPEVTRPVDEALVVKRALKSSSSAHVLGGSQDLHGRTLSPMKGSVKRIEAFVDRVTETVSSARLGSLPVSLSASPTQMPELPPSPHRPPRAVSPMSIATMGGTALPMKRGLLRVPHPPSGMRAGLIDILPTDAD